MDPNLLLLCHRLSLLMDDTAASPEERRAHSQFLRDYGEGLGSYEASSAQPRRIVDPFRRSRRARMNADTECWDNEGGQIAAAPAEGGHTSSSSGRVSRVAGVELPYTVILTRPHGLAIYQSFRTMREAEAFVRRNTPVPAPALSTLYDRPAENP